MHRLSLEYIPRYDAGVFPEEIRRKYGVSRIVNLGSNENPYPPAPSVAKAVVEEAEKIGRYPEPEYSRLKEAIAEYTGVEPANISLGSGASELLSLITTVFLEPLDRVVIPLPTYTMYALFSMIRDASVDFLTSQSFEPEAEEILQSAENSKLVFICSPNNPTGRARTKEEILKMVENTKAIVVVDEAYYEFHGKTVAEYVNEYENLIVVRSFSKFFGLAGLRVGYALADKKTADILERIRNPFTISRVAEAAAIAALEEVEYYRRISRRIVEERERVFSELKKLSEVEVYPSRANFLLINLRKPAREIVERLLSRGVIVRDVSNMPGLEGDYIRVTIGKPEENNIFISALKEVLRSLQKN